MARLPPHAVADVPANWWQAATGDVAPGREALLHRRIEPRGCSTPRCRSPHAHARIVAIDDAPPSGWRGCHHGNTARVEMRPRVARVANPHPWDQVCLTTGATSVTGSPRWPDTLESAEEACRRIVTYELLPAVFEELAECAGAASTPRRTPSVCGNRLHISPHCGQTVKDMEAHCPAPTVIEGDLPVNRCSTVPSSRTRHRRLDEDSASSRAARPRFRSTPPHTRPARGCREAHQGDCPHGLRRQAGMLIDIVAHSRWLPSPRA
jgi:hypothetical protein